MTEDTDSTDHTDITRDQPADEDFVVRAALDAFAGDTPGVVAGPGDDAAVLDFGAPELIVESCDCSVEGVHFRNKWLSLSVFGARAVGRRAVLCSASDMAAMGAAAKTVLVSLGLPPETGRNTVEEIFSGISEACSLIGAAVSGGNTSSSPVMFVDIKITGETRGRGFVRNSGARPGDVIFVTGKIGAADEAMRTLDELTENPELKSRKSDDIEAAVRRFCFPSPRISFGLSLCGVATAMTDVSDGLLLDAGRIASLSSAGAEIFLDKVPVPSGVNPRDAIVSGGDYELVFTVPQQSAKEVMKISALTGVEATDIGRITDGKETVVSSPAGVEAASDFRKRGYVHNTGI